MTSSSAAREPIAVEGIILVLISTALFFDIAGIFGIPFAILALLLSLFYAVGLSRRRPHQEQA